MKKLLTFSLVLLFVIYAFPLLYSLRNGDDFSASAQVDTANYAKNDLSAAETVASSASLPTMTSASSATVAAASSSAAGTSSSEATTEEPVTISVLVNGEVTEMPLETYVTGVVSAEISPTFPTEALKAQAVAARTYAVYKMRAGEPPESHHGADVCDDYHHCAAYLPETACAANWGTKAEAYQKTVNNAVQATAGEIMTVDNAPIVAVFCCAAGKKTESAADVWGSEISYLQSVDSPGGDACSKYKADKTVSLSAFREKIASAFPSADLSGKPKYWFQASVRSAAGGIRTVELGGVCVQGTAVRSLFELNSTNFTVTYGKDNVTFHTTGYGHGVGLSQYGAKYMAEQGSDYRSILTHYYTGISFSKA